MTLGQSLTASPKTVSSWGSAQQQSEEGAVTRANDDPNASQEFEAGLEQQDRDDKKEVHGEGRDVDANEDEEEEEEKQVEDGEQVEHEEKKQEPHKENRKEEEEEGGGRRRAGESYRE